MEEIQHPEINDWITFFLSNPQATTPLTHPYLNLDDDALSYSGALFCHLLSRWFNNNFIKNIWVYSATSNNNFLNDINSVLLNNGQNLKTALKRYAVWRYFTGERDDGNHFPKGHLYPTAKVLRTHNNGTGSGNSLPDDLYSRGGTSYIEFKNADGVINLNFNGQNNTEFAAIALNKRIYFADVENNFTLDNFNDGTLNNQSCIGEDYVVLVPVVTDWQNLQSNISYTYNSTFGTGISTSFWTEKGNTNITQGTLSVQQSSPITSGHSRGLTNQFPYREKTNFERFSNFQGKPVKHNNWNNISSKYFLVNDFEASILNIRQSAQYEFLEPARIQVKLESILFPEKGSAFFLDPWYVLSNGSQPGDHWINFTSEYEPTGKEGATEKGVFLNQEISSGTYYNIWAGDQQINFGSPIGVRQFYLQNWTSTGANIIPLTLNHQRVVFTSPDASVQANLKGQGLSNSEEGYTSNSQRKFVRTNDGVMYNLYESLNRVWLEKSTNNGSSWVIANGGKPIANFNSKNPSMCLTPLGDTYPISIVLESDGTIFFYEYRIATDQVIYRTDISTGNYYTETKPVVTYCFTDYYIHHPQGPVVIWQSLEDDGFGGRLGLHYVALNMDDWNMSQIKHLIPNTDGNSYNPSIAGNDPIHSDITWKHSLMKFNLVWEQRGSVNSSIMFYQVERLANNALDFTDFQNISAFNGYSKNYKPSIISIKDDNDNLGSRVVWLAERYQAEEERLEKGQGSENTEGAQYKTFFKDVGVSGFRSYGNKSNAPTINKLNNNSDYYLAFSEQSNLAGKVVIGSDPTTINQLETIGKDIQMGNGANENQAIALAFHSANLPYYFNRSANMSNVTPKIKSLAIVSGREGVVGKDTAQFYFTVGDVILDDQPIEFIELPDTALINGKEILNEYLVTNPFTLNDNSAFYYSVQYGITDSASAIQALTDSVFINFTVQLLDANTDEIIGTFDNVTYNSDSVFIYNNIAYQVNVSGLNNRLVKLRLKTETNHQFDYSLTQRYAEESVLGKKFIKQINFNAGVIITEYALEQNYPNPFNPSTTIRYQLPQDGMVTLKVYDILGSEVAALVNEQKTAGRYEVNFDASRFASGVYIYKITSGGYVSSKKMLLVK
jgi:hypothetical protein